MTSSQTERCHGPLPLIVFDAPSFVQGDHRRRVFIAADKAIKAWLDKYQKLSNPDQLYYIAGLP